MSASLSSLRPPSWLRWCSLVLELKYAMGAIVALMHDVIITVGIFSIFDKEFTLPIIAALLTIIGYSLNDTIIVFDRIRENLRKYHKHSIQTIINRSVNETLGRTILTSVTTLVVLVTLFVLGGGIIHDFAFAMIVGVLVGTYSSIYVASPILIAWQEFGRKNNGIPSTLVRPEKRPWGREPIEQAAFGPFSIARCHF